MSLVSLPDLKVLPTDALRALILAQREPLLCAAEKFLSTDSTLTATQEQCCTKCDFIAQEEARSRPITRGMASRGLLAHVFISKYCDHLPLYRQSEMYGRQDVELERSTLADWVGGSAQLLEPLVEALRRYVTAASKLHTADRPVPALALGNGKTNLNGLDPDAYLREVLARRAESSAVALSLPIFTQLIEDGDITNGMLRPVGCIATAADEDWNYSVLWTLTPTLVSTAYFGRLQS
jgi:transposase